MLCQPLKAQCKRQVRGCNYWTVYRLGQWVVDPTNADLFTKTLVFRDTPPGQLPTGEVYTGQRPGLDTNVFEYPGNVSSISLSESADHGTLRQWVLGGFPEGMDVDYKPRGAWENFDYLGAGWAMFEDAESSKHTSVSDPATLRGYAEVYGRRATPPVPAWTVTVNGNMDPVIGSYRPGDWCRVVVEDDFIEQRIRSGPEQVTGIVKRIMGFSVSVPTVPQQPETVTLELMDEWGAA